MDGNHADLLHAILNSYRSTLDAVGEGGMKGCPPAGSTLRDHLQVLRESLAADSSPEAIDETGKKIEAELARWGGEAATYFKQRVTEVKELILILARSAELTGERDQRYSQQLQDFTGRLEAMADLHDLALIRDSLVESATSLRACAAAMAEESRQCLEHLRADLSTYQTRLDDAERMACEDPLTGLDNRRRVEAAIEQRLLRKKAFSVLMLDLNGFKQINDACGHQAADEILKQFSAELKAGFRATDVVGRIGGDEFVVVLDAGLREADAHIKRISHWVCGDYRVQVGDSNLKILVSASIGAAEWRPGDSVATLLERADAAMYQEKRQRTKTPELVPTV